MPIYTKTGDKGETSLFGGKRVAKSEVQVEAYGALDELNSWMGLLNAEIPYQEKKEFITKIQTDLFVIGGNLAGWKSDLAVLATRVTEMEVEIDAMESEIPKLQSFILPGGTPLSSQTHVARSVCRRVERQIVGFFRSVPDRIPQEDQVAILQYLNRLSDLLFILARFINRKFDVADVPWTGIERKK